MAPALHDHGLSPLSRIDPAQFVALLQLLEAAEPERQARVDLASGASDGAPVT
jgi:hypothetical protein